MKYRVPKCDCGTELVTWRQEAITITKRINRNGKEFKKENIQRGIDNLNWERLCCPKCFRECERKEDQRGRIIRGMNWR